MIPLSRDLHGNISDVVGKHGVVTFIFNIYFHLQVLRMLALYLLRLYNGEPLYETKGNIETPGLCIFGWS